MQVKSFRFGLHELGGALGDLGTLLPLTIALVTLNHMSATGVFLVVGAGYVMAGLFYRLPVPVQPLKAVATIAIATGLSAGVVSASGLVMAAFLLLVAGTGAIGPLARLFPRMIVRGVQLGIGLLLVKAGLELVSKHQVVIGSGESSVVLASLTIPVGWLLALGLGAIFVLFLRSKRLPASLALLAFGIGTGAFWGSFVGLPELHFALALPAVNIPSLADISTALVLLIIPQIPLTLGNAVFATADTAKAYFGPRASRVTPKALLTTMGIANLGAGLLGGAPVCHGSGGLTAHYRLGARTGGAALLIGLPLLGMALFLDGNVLPILSLVPYPVLGVLVIFVGVQHALLIQDLSCKREFLVALAVAVPGLLTTNLTLGLACGFCLNLGLVSLSRKQAIWLTTRHGVGSLISYLRR